MKKSPSAGARLPSRGPVGTGGHSMLERLEARIVLSGTYYAWTGVDTLPGYDAEFGEPDSLAGMSENGHYMWSAAAADRSDPDEPYLVAGGEVHYLREIAGLADAEIAGINSAAIVLATDAEGDDAGRVFSYDLAGSGTRVYIDELELDAPPGFEPPAVGAIAITDSGALLLAGPLSSENTARLWIVIEARVTKLWEGFGLTGDLYIDSNRSNAVVGYRIGQFGAPAIAMLWAPESGLVDLGAEGIEAVGSVNNDGWVLAKQQDKLVLWRDGAVEPAGYEDDYFDGIGGWTYWPGSRAGDGTLVVTATYADRGGSWSNDGVDHPTETVHIHIPPSRAEESLRAFESGLILSADRGGPSRVPGGWYGFVEAREFYAVPPGELATPWIFRERPEVWTRLSDGAGIRFAAADHPDGGWLIDENIAWIGTDAPLQRDVLINPRTGNMLLISTERGFLAATGADGQEDGYAQARVTDGRHFIVRSATGFFHTRGTPVIAGFNGDSRLMLLYVPPDRPQSSTIVDLTDMHLASRGLQTPQFVGNLDSFMTGWGAMNIVGLDGSGDLHAVWWSPGLRSPLWTTSNLSRASGAPKLVGNIAASATPWNGMQIMGTDSRGHLISIWWAPGSGGWRWSDLTAITGGAPLEPGSIAGTTTGWGAIEVVGRTSENEVVTYWWAPGRDSWTYESITAQQSGATPRIVGPVSLALGPDGSQHIAGVSAEGEVIHLYWLPDAQDLWRGENLTALAVG